MPLDLLEIYIRQHIEACGGREINFSWHGGEPTLLGLDYFREIVRLQRKHKPAGKRIGNGVQTNGALIDEEWCRFFAAEGFSVGVSIDGPAELHDCFRVTRGREPTHRKAERAFELLQRHKVVCDIVCVVHTVNVKRPIDVYRYFRALGARYIGFLPLVERTGTSEVSERSVEPEAFGHFLCLIFDQWIRRDYGRIAVQIFEEASRPLRGMEHSLCIFRLTCGEIPVVEHNGDFYCCDHFVDFEHRVGNIRETPLSELLDSRRQCEFGEAKLNTLPGYCRRCPVLDMCNGACPKDRFLQTPDGEPGLNYLCAGYRRFFSHCRLPLLNLAKGERDKRVAERIRLPEPASRSSAAVARNDPCPCGSGRKYKKCCLGG